MSILSINNISKYFGDHCVLNNISFEIHEPTILALVAPNGSGKSTLLNILTNIERPDDGEIFVLDKPHTDPMIFEKVTYLQDNSVLYLDLTGYDHLEFVRSVHDLSTDTISSFTESLGMTDYLNKKVKNYSLGMKQHLLFAMSVLPDPKLIILDEPLNGLDPSSVMKVRTILKELYRRGSTILFSSHNLDEIDRLTDNILFLHEGELISSKEYQQFKLEYTFVLEAIDQTVDFFQENDLEHEKIAEKKISVSLSPTEYEMFIQFCNEKQIEIHDCSVNKESTQNIYFDLFRGTTNDIT